MNDRPREGTAYRLSVWLIVWGIAFLAPFLILDRLLGEAVDARLKNRVGDARERASAAMTTLEEHLDRPHLLAEAIAETVKRWPAFAARASTTPTPGTIDISAAQAFTAGFRRRFPENSSLFWFDAVGIPIKVDTAPPPDGMRVWQALYRLANAPRQVSVMDRRLAENFLQTRLGPLAKPTLIEKLERQPLEILLRGRPHFLAFVRLPGLSAGTPSPGSLLILLPLFDAPSGWELRRAEKRLSRPHLAIGGIWLSNNRTVGRWPLDPGMLHGLSNRYRNGENTLEYRDHLFLTRPSTRDPDLLLSVATRLDASTGNSGASLVRWRQVLQGSIALSGLLVLGFALSGWHPRVSLAAKASFGASLLAGLPLIAVLLFGIRHLAQLEQNRLNDSQQRLLGRLDRFDQEIAEGQIQARDHIRRLTSSSLFIRGQDSGEIRRSLAKLISEYGLKRVFYWHQDGTTIRWGWSSQADRRLVGIQLGMIQESLRRLNLEGAENIQLPPGVSSETAMIFRGMGIDNSMNSLKGLEGLNRLQRMEAIQFGSAGWFFYQDFLSDPVSKRCVGYFNLIFERSKVLRWLTREARSNLPRDSVRVAWRPEESRETTEAGFTSRLIAQARRHNGLVVEARETGQGKLLGFSRPSKGFPILTAALTRLDRDDPQRVEAMQWLAIVFCLALGGALAATLLAKRLLLEPVQELNLALLAVGGGEYHRLEHIKPGDELGQLAERYHQMVAGLEEKARMSRFLRSSLATPTEAGNQGKHRVERRSAVLLFAGLRDFTSFERAVTPETAMGLMNTFLGTVEEHVRRQGGEIDKFIGDTAMAVFFDERGSLPCNADPEVAVAARRAVAAALEISRAFGETSGSALPLSFGIGLAAGSVVTGPIGSERRRLDFTVIGDPVNLAARLEKLAGREGMPSILADGSVRQAVELPWEELPIRSVRGKTEMISIFTPRDPGGLS